MVKYVALLRGINVGGRKKVNMAELRQALTSVGLQNVKTVLASGNVVFEAPGSNQDGLVSTIEERIRATFGFDVRVVLRTFQEMQDLVLASPFASITTTPQTRLYVTFLSERLDSRLTGPHESPDQNFRILRVSDGEVCSVFQMAPDARSTNAMEVLEKRFGKDITTRNWNTVVKIARMDS